MHGFTDDALVDAALQGSQEAFGELAKRYRRAVFGIAFSYRFGQLINAFCIFTRRTTGV